MDISRRQNPYQASALVSGHGSVSVSEITAYCVYLAILLLISASLLYCHVVSHSPAPFAYRGWPFVYTFDQPATLAGLVLDSLLAVALLSSNKIVFEAMFDGLLRKQIAIYASAVVVSSALFTVTKPNFEFLTVLYMLRSDLPFLVERTLIFSTVTAFLYSPVVAGRLLQVLRRHFAGRA